MAGIHCFLQAQQTALESVGAPGPFLGRSSDSFFIFYPDDFFVTLVVILPSKIRLVFFFPVRK